MPPDDTDGLEEADLPGLDSKPPAKPAEPPGATDPPAPEPPFDPIAHVDRALENTRASEAAEKAAREAEKALIKQEYEEYLLQRYRESLPPEDPVFDDLGQLDLPRQFVQDIPQRSETERVMWELRYGDDPAGTQGLKQELDRLLDAAVAEIPKWVDPTSPPTTEPVPPVVDPLGGALDDLEPMDDGQVRPAISHGIDRAAARFRFKVPIIIGGFGLIGLMLLAIFVVDGGEDPVTTLPPASTGATTTPPTQVETPVETTGVTPPALSDVPLATNSNYTATKTADLTTPPEFLTVAPVGASYPGVLVVDTACDDTSCGYDSRYDLEAEFLESAEFGQREDATWESDGGVWSVTLVAHTIQSQTGAGICVIANIERWEITITEADLIDGRWVASAFEGTLQRSIELDQALSNAPPENCGQWQHVEMWAVSGTAGT